jgi:hypothetical protein
MVCASSYAATETSNCRYSGQGKLQVSRPRQALRSGSLRVQSDAQVKPPALRIWCEPHLL